MNQIARPLGWLRDLLKLTSIDLPQSLDTGGGIRPVLDIAGNGEQFGNGWVSAFSLFAAGTAIGNYGPSGLPFPPALPGFITPPSIEPGDYQTIIHAISAVNVGATAKTFRLNIKAPNNALDVEHCSVTMAAAGRFTTRDILGDRKRLIIPPFCGIGIENVAAIPAGENVTFKYIFTFVPSGLNVGA